MKTERRFRFGTRHGRFLPALPAMLVGLLAAGNLGAMDAAGPHWDNTIGQPGLLGNIRKMVVHDDGSGPALYVGGEFNSGFDIFGADNIARWNGTEWSKLAIVGTNSVVTSLALFNDGSGAGTCLYAGGAFTSVGGLAVPANRIIRWNGSSWSTVGTGFDSTVYSLGVHEGDLFAGGGFFFSGSTQTFRIARGDCHPVYGMAWSGVGGGLATGNGRAVHAFATFDNRLGGGPALYAAGWFETAGGVRVDNIAKWDGAAWAALAGGTTTGYFGRIWALAVFDDGTGEALYAGGEFTTAGGNPANHIARWNGSAWSTLGQGTDGNVLALAVHDDGSGSALYVGGQFLNAGGQPAANIARWNASGWSALDGGVNGKVEALCTNDDGSGLALFVGGWFTEANGQPASRIALWRGGTPTPDLGDINGDGLLNVADVTRLGHLVSMGTPPEKAVGDINGDNVVDMLDVQALAELTVAPEAVP